jgi:hypothetical protein
VRKFKFWRKVVLQVRTIYTYIHTNCHLIFPIYIPRALRSKHNLNESNVRCKLICWQIFSWKHFLRAIVVVTVNLQLWYQLWRNRLNYTGSNMQVLSQGLQRTSNGVTHWSVESSSNTTTVQQDRSRFTSREGEFTITAHLINLNLQISNIITNLFQTVSKFCTDSV